MNESVKAGVGAVIGLGIGVVGILGSLRVVAAAKKQISRNKTMDTETEYMDMVKHPSKIFTGWKNVNKSSEKDEDN
jgi:hypothetical protein